MHFWWRHDKRAGFCLGWQRGEGLQDGLTVAYIYLKSCYSNDGSKLFPIVSGKRQ